MSIQSAINSTLKNVAAMKAVEKVTDEPDLQEQVKQIGSEQYKGTKGKEEYLKKNVYANTQLEKSMLKKGDISGAYEANKASQEYSGQLDDLRKRRETARKRAFAKRQEKAIQKQESDNFRELFMSNAPLQRKGGMTNVEK